VIHGDADYFGASGWRARPARTKVVSVTASKSRNFWTEPPEWSKRFGRWLWSKRGLRRAVGTVDKFMAAGTPPDPMTGSLGSLPREPLISEEDLDLGSKPFDDSDK